MSSTMNRQGGSRNSPEQPEPQEGDRYRHPPGWLALGAPLLVFALHGLGLEAGLYSRWPHFDSLLHLLGGMAGALTLLWLCQLAARLGWYGAAPWVTRLLVVGLMGLVTIGWELFELLGFPHWQPSIADTIKDQLLGVSGATLSALLVRLPPAGADARSGSR